MPVSQHDLQQHYLNTGEGANAIANVIKGSEDTYTTEGFIVSESLDKKLGVKLTGVRLLAKDIIAHMVKNFAGANYVSVAIRGDNRCSLRSMMAGSLIAARRLMYLNKHEQAHKILDTLQHYADDLYALHVNPPKTHLQLLEEFNQTQYNNFRRYVDGIRNQTIGIADIVGQANKDFSKAIIAESCDFNVACSALAAYITDRQLQVQVDGLGGLISKENLSDEGNAYAVLSPGERGSTSADRAAFLAAIGIQNQIIITRIDSVVQAIGQSVDDKGEKIVTINQVLQSERLCRQFKNVTTENDRAIEVDATMVSFNSGGHFNLVLSECDVTLMQAEINQRQENFIKAGKLQEKSEPSMIAQAIQDNDEYEGEKKHKTDKPADSVVQTAVKKDDNDERGFYSSDSK